MSCQHCMCRNSGEGKIKQFCATQSIHKHPNTHRHHSWNTNRKSFCVSHWLQLVNTIPVAHNNAKGHRFDSWKHTYWSYVNIECNISHFWIKAAAKCICVIYSDINHSNECINLNKNEHKNTVYMTDFNLSRSHSIVGLAFCLDVFLFWNRVQLDAGSLTQNHERLNWRKRDAARPASTGGVSASRCSAGHYHYKQSHADFTGTKTLDIVLFWLTETVRNASTETSGNSPAPWQHACLFL